MAERTIPGMVLRNRLELSGIFFAALSGCLLFLSFPNHGNGIIAWFSLVPLFYVLQYLRLKQAIIAGILTGFVFYAGLLYWIVFVVVTYGNMPVYFGLLTMLLLSLYLSLYVGIFAGMVVLIRKWGLRETLFAPFIWVILEYGKSNLLTGFPWENLGYSQYKFIPLIQIADITGIYGLSFVIVLVNAAIYRIVFHREKRKAILEVGLAFLLIACLYTYGIRRMAEVDSMIKNSADLPVVLIQGNIDQSIKWNPEYQRESINIYQTLSLDAAPVEGGLIIWPETAMPFFFQQRDEKEQKVRAIAAATGNWLLFGSPSYQKAGKDVSFYNSAYLISPEGEIAGKYDKVHLVPYGEYVPLRRYFPFISKLVVGLGDFSSGPGYIPLAANGVKLGTLICYEAIFPQGGLLYRREGANLLVNITNDAWFGRTSAPYQHLSMAAIRAVENRLFLVRAANTGISAVIDPTGRILKQTGLFERSSLKAQVKLPEINTIYLKFGDIFVLFCIVILSLTLTIILIRRTFHVRRNYIQHI